MRRSSRKLPSKELVLDLLHERCAATCPTKGMCEGICTRSIGTFTIDAIIQATAELCQRSETGPSEDGERFRWLFSEFRKIEVVADATFDNSTDKPAASFRYIRADSLGRQWDSRSESLNRIRAAIDFDRLSERGGGS